MYRIMHKSKIHRATVTDANLNYEGSITIDKELLEAADIILNEQVQVVNINTGARLTTYVIQGEKHSGSICLNGAAARLAEIGDKVIIISYGYFHNDEINNFSPKIIKVDNNNKLV